MKYIFDPMSPVNQGVVRFAVMSASGFPEVLEVLMPAC
jgi:hypothetical protein